MAAEAPAIERTDDRIQVRLPSRADYLGAVRSVVRGFVEECLSVRLPESEIAEIQICLQEALINVVRHAHRNDRSIPLVLSIIPSKDRLVLEVEDYGKGLPEVPPPDPDPENPREGGYGLFIIRQTMDEVRSEFRDGKHVLILVKELGHARRDGEGDAP